MARDDRYVPALRLRCLTPAYDVVVRTTTRERSVKRALIEQAGLRSGHRVLDLATGTGTLAIRMKQYEPLAEIVAIDGDADVLEIAQGKSRRAGLAIEWLQALAQDLPFPTGHFDRVVTSLFFHHLSADSKVRTAHEVFRVLRPGGELHVADWGRPTNPAMRGLFFAVQMLDGFENTRDNIAGKLVSYFRQAGFMDVAATRSLDTPLGTMVLYRGTKPAIPDG
jgi:ubiquinone/menaquinone biosynthesis C-methylase UbiE